MVVVRQVGCALRSEGNKRQSRIKESSGNSDRIYLVACQECLQQAILENGSIVLTRVAYPGVRPGVVCWILETACQCRISSLFGLNLSCLSLVYLLLLSACYPRIAPQVLSHTSMTNKFVFWKAEICVSRNSLTVDSWRTEIFSDHFPSVYNVVFFS